MKRAILCNEIHESDIKI